MLLAAKEILVGEEFRVGLLVAIGRCWALLSVLAPTVSACQTLEDASGSNNGWRSAPLPWPDVKQGSPRETASNSLRRDEPVSEPSLVEGTGRFVGDRASASQQGAASSGEDGVTLNLVNVPVQQAANTILADIIGVKYTIDPKIDGRVTIQTPPRSRARPRSIYSNQRYAPITPRWVWTSWKLAIASCNAIQTKTNLFTRYTALRRRVAQSLKFNGKSRRPPCLQLISRGLPRVVPRSPAYFAKASRRR